LPDSGRFCQDRQRRYNFYTERAPEQVVSKKIITVSIVLIPEAVASTLLSVYDIFTLFEQVVPGDTSYKIKLVAESITPVLTASNIPLQPGATFDSTSASDIVVLPALLLPHSGWEAGKHSRLIDWLRRQYHQGAVMCSACSGIFPLMETGLFDAQPITCHWYYEPMLRRAFPHANICIEKALQISADQRLIMSGASGSWHDLVLFLITQFSGPAAATTIARFFLLNWHAEGQAPYARFMEDVSHNDASVLRAQAWIRQHWMHTNPIEEMVRISGLPERSFIRRFKNMTGLSPMEYIQHTRIEHARQLLETSSLPVDTIAGDIGYEDPAFFRKLFKRITSMTPSAYRLKFRIPYQSVG
jgi:transcriptional regulator GlxA family with amidase domain